MSPNPRVEQSEESTLPAPPLARWEVRPCDGALARALAHEAGIPPLLARILMARGLGDARQADAFLNPSLTQTHDPFLLKGMDKATARIDQALEHKESIWIYGDYDVDGTAATAILHHTLNELGGRVDYYIPHRLDEGYGLNGGALAEIAREGAQLVITVDCGITAINEARVARELGLDLIVTDHHEPGATVPEACAVINPKQPGCGYPFKELSGAGVAFKLAHAVLKRCHPDEARARAFLKGLLDLVALGTVADVVPLDGENRPLVSSGLALLREARRMGVAQLIERAGMKKAQLDAGSISFGLAPRLNAAGRTEHAMFSAELLLTEDRRRARDLAEKLEGFNNHRRSIEQAILDEALSLIEPRLEDRVIVLAQDGWHPGVLGIVASRILGRFYRPTIIIAIDGETAKGSGRSIPGFDLHAALSHCDGCLTRFGGHKMAAGLTVAADRIEEFRLAINAYASEKLDAGLMQPVIEIDAVAEPGELKLETVRLLERLAPFGQGNPKPVIALEDYQLIENPWILKGRHLKLRAAGPAGEPLTVLGWNMAHHGEELENYRGRIRLAGTPSINDWNGRTSVELVLKDFQIE